METKLILLSFFIALLSFAAWKQSLLNLSGAIAAFIVGCSIAFGFGISGLVLIGVFFISSSLLSNYNKKKKNYLKDIHEKGSTRDWAQVFANGGIAALCGAAGYTFSDPVLTLAFSISLAGANADTWASELGSLSKRPPISIKNFNRVTAGTSGAISLFGTVAGFFGALLIATIAMILFQLDLFTFFLILLLGFGAMVIDTILGAYFQAEYKCSSCGSVIEKPHHCEKKASLVKGYRWLRNDAVNFSSNLLAVLIGIILYVQL